MNKKNLKQNFINLFELGNKNFISSDKRKLGDIVFLPTKLEKFFLYQCIELQRTKTLYFFFLK